VRRLILTSILAGLLAGTVLVAPAVAARGCTLALDVPARSAYGETVVLHVSGLSGVGGIDIFTQHRRVVDEQHLFLVPGITEFDMIYRWQPEGFPPLPPLEPGHYVVHAVDAFGCVARTTFHVSLPAA